MQFIRGAWRFLVAIKNGLVLLAMILFFAALYTALSYRPNAAAIHEGALLLDLKGVVVEEPAAQSLTTLLSGGSDMVREYRLRDIVQSLRAAKDDKRVKAVVLDLSFFLGGGQTTLSSIGDALEEVKKAGKPVYAFANFYSDDSYLLAAHANELWMDPMGGVIFAGPGGNRLYYKGLLDQLGVTANVFRVGTYKSAVEPYIRSDQSPDARIAAEALYGSLWEQWLASVKKARPSANTAGYAADPAGFMEAARGDYTKIALEQKLIDKTGDRVAFGRYIASKVGIDKIPSPDSFKAIKLDDYVAANPVKKNGSAIGVITIAGVIESGEAGPGTAASGRIASQIYKALDDDDLKALVVRIDSPGGSAFASEEIRLALVDVQKKKIPIVVSMGDVAASGGYWAASAGDEIFAESDTITGSIGVFAVLPSFEKALAKWGVNADGVQTTPLSGQPDLVGGLNKDLNTVLQSGVEHSYSSFIGLVAKSRKMTPEKVDEIGQGRVWTGGMARQIGLVDSFGGMDEALASAAKRAGLKAGEYHPKYLDAPSPFGLLGSIGLPFVQSNLDQTGSVNGVFGWVALQQKLSLIQALNTAAGILAREDIQALCLECGSESVAQPSKDSAGFLSMVRAYLAPR